jgi:prevent-host-death family protein
MKTVALAKVKDDLSGYLRRAEREGIVITRHGRPAGVLIGFETEDDWLEYRIEHNPEFLRRIAQARAALARGEGIRLEDLERKTSKRRRPPTSRKKADAVPGKASSASLVTIAEPTRGRTGYAKKRKSSA